MTRQPIADVRQLWNDTDKSTAMAATECPHKSHCTIQNLQLEWVSLYQLTENKRLTHSTT